MNHDFQQPFFPMSLQFGNMVTTPGHDNSLKKFKGCKQEEGKYRRESSAECTGDWRSPMGVISMGDG